MEPLNKSADLSALRIDRQAGPGARRFLYPAVATLCVALAGVLLFARTRGGVAFRTPEVTTTRAALVTPTQASAILTASGYIVARSKAEISPKTVGRIAWINLEEGQRVRKGELVARLEAQELDAQKRSALAQRDQALAQLANARLDRTRAVQLLGEKIGTQQAFDTADSQVKALEAQVASNEAQARYYEEQIKNAEIYAPIDGVVTVKKAFLGETVAPQGFGGAGSAGATFAIIVDLSSLEMEADINEQNVGKLVLSQPAEVALDAYPDKPYKARLRQIVPTDDRQKGSVKVKIEIAD
ncbi:MAG: efflux RND transporter periplasmic adaptor subunit, partial [Thermoanaerobaculia bacterium]